MVKAFWFGVVIATLNLWKCPWWQGHILFMFKMNYFYEVHTHKIQRIMCNEMTNLWFQFCVITPSNLTFSTRSDPIIGILSLGGKIYSFLQQTCSTSNFMRCKTLVLIASFSNICVQIWVCFMGNRIVVLVLKYLS